MARTPILCIGEVLWDALPAGLFPGGAPFNVACHLKMLGEEVAFASRIGEDELGRQILRRMQQKGLASTWVQVDEEQPTGIVNVTLTQRDNPSYEIVQPAAWDFIALVDGLAELAGTARAVVFGSLAQRHAVSRATIEILRRRSALAVFDVNLRPPFIDRGVIEASLQDADLVKLNEKELQQLAEWFGFAPDLQDAAAQLAEAFACDSVCVTRGARGAGMWRAGRWLEHPGFSVPVRDAVGAGDAFLAALLSGLLAEKPLDKVLAFANATGAFVATKDGAVPEVAAEVIKQLTEGKLPPEI